MLQAQAQGSDLNGAVRFHGLMTRAEVAELLQTVDVVVAPSVPSRDGRREGIPVALMEALACSVPVVASRLSGIPELVIDGETGLLTPPGDDAALARAIRRLYEDPSLRTRLGAAGRAKIVEAFDLRANTGWLANRFRENGRR
jgi:glycosyltransferase involved in cell wall biosynthesis